MTNNLRIYMVIDTFLPLVGGAEKQAFLQSRYLREQGVAATIITLHYQRNWLAQEILEGVPVLRVAGTILSWREHAPAFVRRCCYFLALAVLGWQLWRRRHEYEILHVFQLTPFALPALFVCRLARKPLLIAMRNDAPPFQQGTSRGRIRTRADLEALARMGRPTLRLLNRQLRQARARLIVLSTRMHASLKQYGLDGAEVLLIPNGVDTEHFQPCLTQQEAHATVVCVAKLRYQKGLDILLQAWRQVLKQMPAARLFIVGDGPLLVSLYHLASNLEIAHSVEFTGFCSDVALYLQRARIAVLPSRWEGMPNALLEAMACGLACVATYVSGSEDLLQNGRYGVLVEPEDAEKLAEALLLLLRKPDLARHYGQLARKHIEQNFAFHQVMCRYQALYEMLFAEYQHGTHKHGITHIIDEKPDRPVKI
ncbi:MAG TPA: glycosyltransferase family 4 protein [Ktedonobacteraceae bacterium]|nr:glycosyltransferase family 4 protein [Ktedonobacteraceae bacterium]